MEKTKKMGWIRAVVICLSCLFLGEVSGHGRLIEPPSRATMWRYGFSTPPDFQDHELFCGGFSKQWQSNGGKCGICGDPWDAPQPRAHEAGGKYAQGIIVRRYKVGATVPIRVELTANHKGYFEFRLCPQNNHRKEATQACLDRYVLQRGDSVGGSRVFPGVEGGGGNRIFEARYRLPDGLTCSQCVLQWRYIAGNNWGTCANGTGAVGCGPQEEFRACSDVSIQSDSGLFDNTPYEGEGEEEEGEGEVDNEIPEGKEDAKSGKAGEVVVEEEEAEEGLFWWGVVLIVVGCAFVAAAALFALLYLYYYHARDGFKKWLKKEEVRRVGVAVCVPVVREENPPAVPPRRLRKNSLSADERVV